jgi:predicted RNA-binding protein (virulence factor B family)
MTTDEIKALLQIVAGGVATLLRMATAPDEQTAADAEEKAKQILAQLDKMNATIAIDDKATDDALKAKFP